MKGNYNREYLSLRQKMGENCWPYLCQKSLIFIKNRIKNCKSIPLKTWLVPMKVI